MNLLMAAPRTKFRAVKCVCLRVALVAAAVLASFTSASAPAAASAEQTLSPAPRVEWSPAWPRFRLWEYVGTAAFGAATLAFDRYGTLPAEPKRQGGVLFDDAARDWLRASSREGRERAGTVSDVLWRGGSAVPFVIDLPVALLIHRQPGVTWQLLMMNLEAFAVAGFINRAFHFELGRGRPSVAECAANPAYDELCGAPSNNASFPSGHTLGVATAAGLTCVHHRYLPLYGGPVADGGVCALMSLATLVTAATRVMADRHHTTDVVSGAMIGFATGYGLPWLLHYRQRDSTQPLASSQRPIFVPFAGMTEVGVGLVGTL